MPKSFLGLVVSLSGVNGDPEPAVNETGGVLAGLTAPTAAAVNRAAG